MAAMIDVVFTKKGALGINFMDNKDARYVYISSVEPGGLGASFPDLKAGLILRKIDGQKVKSTKKVKWDAHAVAAALKKHKHDEKHPLTLLFETPRIVEKYFEGTNKLGIHWKVVEKTGSIMVSGMELDGQASQDHEIYPGMILRTVNTRSIKGKDLHELAEEIRTAPRPLILGFEDNEWTPDRVVVIFKQKGKLGINFKHSKDKQCLYIGSIKGGLAESYPELHEGLILRKLANVREGDHDVSVKGLSLHALGNKIKHHSRPLTLVFNGSTIVDSIENPLHHAQAYWDPNSAGMDFDTTGDKKANARGYDTTGDGKIDSWDTNGDGRIDRTTVSAVNFDKGRMCDFTFSKETLGLTFEHTEKHLVVSECANCQADSTFGMQVGLALYSVKNGTTELEMPKDTFFEDAMAQMRAAGRPLTLLFASVKGDKTITFSKPGSVGIMFEHKGKNIVVQGIVKNSPAHHEEKHKRLGTGFVLKGIANASGEMEGLKPDTFEEDCMKILRACSRPVTLTFHSSHEAHEDVVGMKVTDLKRAKKVEGWHELSEEEAAKKAAAEAAALDALSIEEVKIKLVKLNKQKELAVEMEMLDKALEYKHEVDKLEVLLEKKEEQAALEASLHNPLKLGDPVEVLEQKGGCCVIA